MSPPSPPSPSPPSQSASSQLPSPEMSFPPPPPSPPPSPPPPPPSPPPSPLQSPSLSSCESSSSLPAAPSSRQPLSLSSSRPYVGFEFFLSEIFGYLPLSALARFLSVSSVVRIHIRSLPATHPFPREPFFFLHYSWTRLSSVVYNPLYDDWRCLSVSRFPTASSGCHLLITSHSFRDPRVCDLRRMVSSFHLFNPFSNVTIAVPTPTTSMMAEPYHGLTLTFDEDNNYRILAFTDSLMALQIYDSSLGRWAYHPLSLPIFSNSLVNSVFLDGWLYVLTGHPVHLLIMNPQTVQGHHISEFPLTECRHLMVSDGRVFVAGWGTRTVEVWQLVQNQPAEWKFVDRMPHQLLSEFGRVWIMRFLDVCSGGGFICFCHSRTHRLVVFDVMTRTWRMASPNPYADVHTKVWLGFAVQPTIADIRR